LAIEKRNIENARLFFTKPISDHVRNVNAFFKNLAAPLNALDDIYRRKMRGYLAIEESKRKAKEAELAKVAERQHKKEEKVAKKKKEPPPIYIAPKVKDRTKDVAGVVKAKVWTYEIEDENKLPERFWLIDEAKIRTEVQSGNRNIPGVRIYQKEQIRVNGG